MLYRPRALALCLLVLPGLLSASQADETQLLPQTGVVVLQSGRVLRGDILRVGDRYVVALGNQDEVSVPADAVAMQCVSLSEAYQRQRIQLQETASVADHLELANWCLRYDLLPEAAEQLMCAQRQDPADPANERFEKRLKLAAQRGAPAEHRPRSEPPIVEQTDLDELQRHLPPDTIEQFTRTIQPLLINRCGLGACHGPNGSTEFRLMYPHRSRTIPRRFTQRNLQTALDAVNPDAPQQSPLLVKATQIHGGAERPPLAPQDVEQLHLLAQWTYRSLLNNHPSPPPTLKAPEPLLMQPLTPQPALGAEPAPNASLSIDPMASLPIESRNSESDSTVAAAGGRDPFDPEIFNRQFGATK